MRINISTTEEYALAISSFLLFIIGFYGSTILTLMILLGLFVRIHTIKKKWINVWQLFLLTIIASIFSSFIIVYVITHEILVTTGMVYYSLAVSFLIVGVFLVENIMSDVISFNTSGAIMSKIIIVSSLYTFLLFISTINMVSPY